jgi:hypothetical protein
MPLTIPHLDTNKQIRYYASMKETDPMDALRRYVSAYKTQAAAASALDITPAYLSDLLAGRRNFSERMLAALGLKQIVVKS